MKTHDSMKKIILLVKKHYNLKKYNPESKLGIRLNEWKGKRSIEFLIEDIALSNF